MNQTRLVSFIETMINILIGFAINFVANLVILPMFGFESLTLTTNFEIGLLYTVISVIRSYVIRRWFNAGMHAVSAAMAVQMWKRIRT
jgi:hypothetical protein